MSNLGLAQKQLNGRYLLLQKLIGPPTEAHLLGLVIKNHYCLIIYYCFLFRMAHDV